MLLVVDIGVCATLGPYQAPVAFTALTFSNGSTGLARQVIEERVVQEDLVRQTGIPRSNIHKWVGQARRGELAGYTAPSPESKSGDLSAEVRRLERELSEVRMERDFLKKTAAYFARERR